VPVKTAEAMEAILSTSDIPHPVEVLANPEFLAEGTAISDLLTPDRVLVGGRTETEQGQRALNIVCSIYETWVDSSRVLRSSAWSAELSKLAANAFLAQRVSSINSLSAVCDATGANIDEVAKAVGTDSRIGDKFLKASVGFGGSCFEKDIRSLVYLCETLPNLQVVAQYWRSVIDINHFQRARFSDLIISSFFNSLRLKTIAILGFAFKAETSDTRESSAISVCSALLKEQARLRVYDPKVPAKRVMLDLTQAASSTMEPWEYRPGGGVEGVSAGWKAAVEDGVKVVGSVEDAVKGAHAIVVMTEWEEFKHIDFAQLKSSMIPPFRVFDGRGVINADNARQAGFEVYMLGRPAVTK